VDAALKARDLDRHSLLSKNKTPQNSTYHPHDQSMRKMLHQNWDFLGKSQTTEFLHKKHLMCGYRRPKNLRDILMRANIPAKVGDEQADPNHLLLSTINEAQEEPKIQTGPPPIPFVKNPFWIFLSQQLVLQRSTTLKVTPPQ
jgi:hypothetical protein